MGVGPGVGVRVGAGLAVGGAGVKVPVAVGVEVFIASRVSNADMVLATAVLIASLSAALGVLAGICGVETWQAARASKPSQPNRLVKNESFILPPKRLALAGNKLHPQSNQPVVLKSLQ